MADKESPRKKGHPDDLTWREQEVLNLLGERLTNKEIAERLYLAESTIKDYVSKILEKLYVKNRREAVNKAADLGLLNQISVNQSADDSSYRNFPSERTPFVGRELELSQIQKQLESVRLLTLIGPGGIGKTRLAIRCARMAADNYRDGCYFVSLSPLRSAEDIVQAIAEGVNYPIATEEPPFRQLLRYLRSRQLLLVLDNFEHLLNGANIISQILEDAADVCILVTSRERLNLLGESILFIEGMSHEDQAGEIRPGRSDAINLFIQCTRRIRSGYDPGPDELEEITQICEFVGGMPLAIELAAAWQQVMTIEDIHSELSQNLDLLATITRDAPERHRSIRRVFDHSWDLLEPAERKIFARLSIFRGGFTRESAEIVGNATIQDIAALVDKSLLSHDAGTGRFESHELLRQFAEEKLEEDKNDASATRERHGAFFAEFMEKTWQQLRGPDQKETISLVKEDIDNVRAGWDFFLHNKNIPMLWKYIYGIWYFYWIQWWNQPAMALFQNTADELENCSEPDANALRCLAQALQCYFMAWLGLSEEGYHLSHSSAVVLEKLGWKTPLIFALYSKTINAYFQFSFKEQLIIKDQMLDVAVNIDDPWVMAFTLYAAGLACVANDDFEQAILYAKKQLEIYEKIGDAIGMTTPLIVLGHAAMGLGELEKAYEYYRRCLDISLESEYYYSIQTSSKYLAKVALALNNLEETEINLKQALEITNEIGFVRDIVNLVYEYARLFNAKGQLETAARLLSLVIHHPESDRHRMLDGRIRDNAKELMEHVRSGLSPSAFDRAESQGKNLDLDEVSRILIAKEYEMV